MTKIFESNIEQFAIELLQAQGYHYLSPEAQEEERNNLDEVVLKDRLRAAIDTLNPTLSQEVKEQAFKQVLNLPSQNLMDNNDVFHRMLTEGIEVEYMGEHGIKGDKAWLVDKVRKNTSIDWTLKESVQSKLRVIVRRTLRQFGYPPDLQLLAVENVLRQAELLADDLIE